MMSLMLLGGVLKAITTIKVFKKRLSLVEKYEKKQIAFSEELREPYETLKAKEDIFAPDVIHFKNKTVVVKEADQKQLEIQLKNLLDAFKE